MASSILVLILIKCWCWFLLYYSCTQLTNPICIDRTHHEDRSWWRWAWNYKLFYLFTTFIVVCICVCVCIGGECLLKWLKFVCSVQITIYFQADQLTFLFLFFLFLCPLEHCIYSNNILILSTFKLFYLQLHLHLHLCLRLFWLFIIFIISSIGSLRLWLMTWRLIFVIIFNFHSIDIFGSYFSSQTCYPATLFINPHVL